MSRPSGEQATSEESAQRRWSVGILVSSPVQRGILAILVSGLVAFLTIDYVNPRAFDFDPGDIAARDVRATRTLEIPDKKATERKRKEAALSVRLVFDYDALAGERIAERVHRAFEIGRASLKAAEEAPGESTEGPSSGNPADKDEEEASGGGTLEHGGAAVDPSPRIATVQHAGTDTEDVVTDADTDGATVAADVRREFMEALGVELRGVFYQSLEFMKFDPQVERDVVSIVRHVNQHYILRDKGILPEDLATRGISVLRRDDTGETETVVYRSSDIIDPGEALNLVRKLVDDKLAARPKLHRDTVFAVASGLIQPNLTYNAAVTSQRRAKARRDVAPVTHLIKRGTMIVRAGDPVDEDKIVILQGIAQAKEQYHAGEMFLSMALLALIVIVTTYLFAAGYIRKFATSMKDLVILGIILVFVVALSRIAVEIADALATRVAGIPVSCYYFAIPVACGVVLVRILMNSETAIVFGIVASTFAAILVEYDVFYMAFFFVSGLAAAGGIAHTKERVHVLRGGLVAAGANVIMVLAIFLVQTRMIDSSIVIGSGYLTYDLVFAFFGGLISAILALGVIPFFEMFGYVTDYKLLELANLNHPLLKDLMLHAPGTYHHSVIVGSLSEAAAQEIGCNALLARVACYYHDIGKVRKPEYFIENLRNINENKHDRLSPELSARIIAGHVRDGIELARQYHLPQPIIDMIPQHHGAALISFFYNKALKAAEPGTVVDENEFRYPGPKPQTREAGIIMLADATEASTRSIKDITPAKIRANLQRIFQRIVTDGQLDECPLTLKDLGRISDTFLKVLLGIYHNRIEYPTEYRGAVVPGQGTGAVITLDTEAGNADGRSEGGVPARKSGSSIWTEEFVVTTTAEFEPEDEKERRDAGEERTVDRA